MKNKEAGIFKRRIDELFREIDNSRKKGDSSEFADGSMVLSHMTSYLCVLISAFIESALREVFGEYAKTNAKHADKIVNFVINRLSHSSNPEWDTIVKLTESFDEQWKKKLQDLVQPSDRQAITEVVRKRHRVAHNCADAGIGYRELKNLYNQSVSVVEIVEGIANLGLS